MVVCHNHFTGGARVASGLRSPSFAYFAGACNGIESGSKGRSRRVGIAWIGLPAGSIMVGVTKMTKWFLFGAADLRKKRPSFGKSPMACTLVSPLLGFSVVVPPLNMI